MQNFQNTFETRKGSFIRTFSICMTVPLTSENDTQESLYDTEDIAVSKKARKKCDTFKNTRANDLIKEVKNTPKIINEV